MSSCSVSVTSDGVTTSVEHAPYLYGYRQSFFIHIIKSLLKNENILKIRLVYNTLSKM